jgi:hypothetical protein
MLAGIHRDGGLGNASIPIKDCLPQATLAGKEEKDGTKLEHIET